MNPDLEPLREAIRASRIEWRKHTLTRMMERAISRDAVKQAILQGEVIAVYPEDRPFPSMLIHHALFGEALHVVVACEPADLPVVHVITVYRPDLNHFLDDLKTRRK